MTFISDFFVTLGIDPFIAGLVIGIVLTAIARSALGAKRKGSAYALTSEQTADADRLSLGLGGGPSGGHRGGSSTTLRISYTINGENRDLGPEVAAQIASALANHNKIEAIKLLRQASGLGLKEAKDIVDVIEGSGR